MKFTKSAEHRQSVCDVRLLPVQKEDRPAVPVLQADLRHVVDGEVHPLLCGDVLAEHAHLNGGGDVVQELLDRFGVDSAHGDAQQGQGGGHRGHGAQGVRDMSVVILFHLDDLLQLVGIGPQGRNGVKVRSAVEHAQVPPLPLPQKVCGAGGPGPAAARSERWMALRGGRLPSR